MLSIAGIAVGLGAGWFLWHSGSRDDNSSPIVISDGSVNFREHDHWNVSDSSHVDVKLPGFRPWHIKWALCTPAVSDGTQASCSAITNTDLPSLSATSFSLFLCKTATCTTSVADTNLTSTITWSSTTDPEDILVNSNPNKAMIPPFTFNIQPSANGDGAGLQLCETGGACVVSHLLGAALQVNGTAVSLGACNPQTGQRCVLKIRYCTTNGTGCKGST